MLTPAFLPVVVVVPIPTEVPVIFVPWVSLPDLRNKVPSVLIRTFSGVWLEVLNTIFPAFDGLSTTICKSPSVSCVKNA